MKDLLKDVCSNLESIELGKQKLVVNTINPHSFVVAKNDSDFCSALQKSDYLLPDGIGIVFANKLLFGRRINRISGFDLFMYLVSLLNDINGKVFFLGASPETLQKIQSRLKIDFPNIDCEVYSPPYRQSFTAIESKRMVEAVNHFEPHVLFVGMTAPKQEKWVSVYNQQLNTQIVCSIGAVFDFYAGTIKRPSEFWINLGLEWMVRLIREPRRLFRRNFVSTPVFIIEILKIKLFAR